MGEFGISLFILIPVLAVFAGLFCFSRSVSAALDGRGGEARNWAFGTAVALFLGSLGFWSQSFGILATLCFLLAAYSFTCVLRMER